MPLLSPWVEAKASRRLIVCIHGSSGGALAGIDHNTHTARLGYGSRPFTELDSVLKADFLSTRSTSKDFLSCRCGRCKRPLRNPNEASLSSRKRVAPRIGRAEQNISNTLSAIASISAASFCQTPAYRPSRYARAEEQKASLARMGSCRLAGTAWIQTMNLVRSTKC